jgi:hypothetical protein
MATSRRIALETWDPDYGSPTDAAVLEPTDVKVNPDVELAAAEWRPIAGAAPAAGKCDVLFIDGVRRTDAIAWITEGSGPPFRAILASYAAGAVHVGQSARVISAECCRVLVAAVKTDALITKAGTWAALVTTADTPEQLSLAVQERMTDLEISVAHQHGGATDLIVIDGPLRGRQDIAGAVGYVKTHQVAYLPATLQPVIAALKAGERTPIFRCTTSWSRYSWYLRLPGNASHAWWGVIRLEASERLGVSEVVKLANTTAGVLPRFASVPHKDPRAPQNLFPIGGLERELRRRLGDREIITRLLRAAEH